MSDKKYVLLTVILIALTGIAGLSYLFLKTNRFPSETPQISEQVVQEEVTACNDITVYDYDTVGDAYNAPETVCIIDMSKRGQARVSDDIFLFPNLEVLRLDYNDFQNLPLELAKLTKLKELYLNNNHFTSIPPVVFSLTNLEKLDISVNQLTQVPAEIQNLRKLLILKIVGNQLSTLPPTLGNITSLETLDVSFNNLNELPESFSGLISLDSIFLEQNNFTSIPQAISGMPKLTAVTLTGNSLDAQAVDSLRQALPQAQIEF